MTKTEIWAAIEFAIKQDRKDYPNLPDHAAGQAGKVVVQAGKVLDAAMNFKYDGVDAKWTRLQTQSALIKTAAFAIRALLELKSIEQKYSGELPAPTQIENLECIN